MRYGDEIRTGHLELREADWGENLSASFSRRWVFLTVVCTEKSLKTRVGSKNFEKENYFLFCPNPCKKTGLVH